MVEKKGEICDYAVKNHYRDVQERQRTVTARTRSNRMMIGPAKGEFGETLVRFRGAAFCHFPIVDAACLLESRGEPAASDKDY